MTQKHTKRAEQRWHRRPSWAPSRWYAVEYDEKNVAWLVADTHDRVCLEHGMQLDIAQIAICRPPGPEPEQQPAPQQKKRAKKGNR